MSLFPPTDVRPPKRDGGEVVTPRVRKSKEKQQVVKALYEGNQQTMMRESLGIVTETSGGVFMRKCAVPPSPWRAHSPPFLFERIVSPPFPFLSVT